MIKISEMARMTGISRQTIYNRLKELEEKGLVIVDGEGTKLLKEDAEQYLIDTVKKGVKDRIITVKTEKKDSQENTKTNETVETTENDAVKELVKELLKEKDLRIIDLQEQVTSLQSQVISLQQENTELTKVLAGTVANFTGQKTDNFYTGLQVDSKKQTKKGFFQRLLGK